MVEKTMKIGNEEAFARFCAEQALDKLAEDVVALKVKDLSSIADYFIIVTANSQPHLKALVSHVERQVREHWQVRPLATDGEPASEWALIDFGSVLVHVMGETARRKYELERLWSDAPRLEMA